MTQCNCTPCFADRITTKTLDRLDAFVDRLMAPFRPAPHIGPPMDDDDEADEPIVAVKRPARRTHKRKPKLKSEARARPAHQPKPPVSPAADKPVWPWFSMGTPAPRPPRQKPAKRSPAAKEEAESEPEPEPAPPRLPADDAVAQGPMLVTVEVAGRGGAVVTEAIDHGDGVLEIPKAVVAEVVVAPGYHSVNVAATPTPPTTRGRSFTVRRVADVTPKKTVKRDRAIKEIRIEQMRRLREIQTLKTKEVDEPRSRRDPNGKSELDNDDDEEDLPVVSTEDAIAIGRSMLVED